MGRNPKVGLDYFPLDTTWDIKMQLVKAKYGLEGVGCVIEIFKLIYSEGYYIKWDDDNRLLFAAENKIDENKLVEIVDFACRKCVFHAGKLDNMGILTSSGIQKRWLRIVTDSNRAIKTLDETISVIDGDVFPAQENHFPAQTIPHKNDITGTDKTQRKGKDIKEDNIESEPKESKHKYGEDENVLLRDSERDKLVAEYGQDAFDSIITELSSYKTMSGKKYASDYMAICRWVADKVIKSNPKPKPEYKEPEETPVSQEVQDAIDRQYATFGM